MQHDNTQNNAAWRHRKQQQQLPHTFRQAVFPVWGESSDSRMQEKGKEQGTA